MTNCCFTNYYGCVHVHISRCLNCFGKSPVAKYTMILFKTDVYLWTIAFPEISTKYKD